MIFKNILLKTAILSIAFFSLIACDEDYKEVGADIVDPDNFEALSYKETALSSEAKSIQKVQTNALSSYVLGVYNDSYFGSTTADIVAQFSLSQSDPTFHDDPVLDSVVLNIPYFSTVEDQDQDSGERTYALDSIYGDKPLKLSVYRSGYFLRDFDPTDEFSRQVYYSDDVDKIEQNLVGNAWAVEEEFKPSKEEILIKDLSGDEDADPERLLPALRVKLPVSEFKSLIFDKEGEPELSNNDNFQKYFRGLYLKVESQNNEGTYSLLNFASEEAGITLYYHNMEEDKSSDGDDKEKKVNRRFKLNISGRILNLMKNDASNLQLAEDDLAVKGGPGSVAYIDLFKDPEQLDSLRHTGWLINEANLKLYIDKEKFSSDYDFPERIFVFDATNEKVLKDYSNATDVRDNDILNSRVIQLGRLTKDDDGNLFYKIRLTQYIDDILNREAANTRLGIVVSQNVNESSFLKAETGDGQAVKLPRSEVVARNGVVFFNEKTDSEKALKLEIYYTVSKE